ncbi:cell growth regulator with EF hand domain protein 1 [Loxodonta africana]|uniref:cell growth regulator with EF hand domain protein 1 n=2 Tax=Elephantidae TaxID=9780 RepID=UPI00022348DD|nr:cell growth regulator with EF hand domain protein 1 [Loxodonta africana]
MLPLLMRVLVVPLLLLSLGQAAPKDGATRPKPEVVQQALPNPFLPGEEQLRLLQSYLKGLERMEEEPEHMSREQVLLYLFALHDYDQSGQLDGLELLSMLTAALAPGAADSPLTNPVILVVDKVLETQDMNGDGLMTPAEFINFPGQSLKEPFDSAPQEPHATGRQPLLPKGPLEQEGPEALSLREAGEQVEARRESLEPVQETEGPAKAEAEAPGLGGEAEGHAEAEGEAPGPGGEAGGQPEPEAEGPGPGGEAGGQAEARDTAEEEVLAGETLKSKNTPQEFEVHSIQLENDEI